MHTVEYTIYNFRWSIWLWFASLARPRDARADEENNTQCVTDDGHATLDIQLMSGFSYYLN